jgi:hypothetical protein
MIVNKSSVMTLLRIQYRANRRHFSSDSCLLPFAGVASSRYCREPRIEHYIVRTSQIRRRSHAIALDRVFFRFPPIVGNFQGKKRSSSPVTRCRNVVVSIRDRSCGGSAAAAVDRFLHRDPVVRRIRRVKAAPDVRHMYRIDIFGT